MSSEVRTAIMTIVCLSACMTLLVTALVTQDVRVLLAESAVLHFFVLYAAIVAIRGRGRSE